MCPPPPHKHPGLGMPASRAPQSPSGPIPHPLRPKAHRRPWGPLLRLPPLTSHNLAQICVYLSVSVCSLCGWLTKSPQESHLCVSAHTGRAGCGSRPGLLAERCRLVDQAPRCLSPPPHPAPSSRASLSPGPVTTAGSPPSLLLLRPSLLSGTWGEKSKSLHLGAGGSRCLGWGQGT